jgi:hypothetical protein
VFLGCGSVARQAQTEQPRARVLIEGFQLGRAVRIHLIQALCDSVPLLPVQEFGNRRRVQLTSRYSEAAGSSFHETEKVVGYRDGGLHARSVTPGAASTIAQ